MADGGVSDQLPINSEDELEDNREKKIAFWNKAFLKGSFLQGLLESNF